MGDAVKIAVKTALIVTITAAIVALFANIQVPSLDYTLVTQGMGACLAVLYHYVPVAQVIVPIAFGMLTFELGYYAFKLAMIAIRWVMKVNE